MKKVLFLLLLITTSAFAQVEHGLLVGAGVGFPLQDGWKETTWGDKSNLDYRNDYKLNSMIGYRFRFLPEQKFFYDLDMTMGFQKMETVKSSRYLSYEGMEGGSHIFKGGTETIDELCMQHSVAASCN